MDDGSPDALRLGVVDRIGALIGSITDLAIRLRWLTVVLALLFTFGAGYAAATKLAVHTDTTAMIDEREAFRQNYNRYIAEFEDLRGAILVVVSAAQPEIADFQANRLADRLDQTEVAAAEGRQQILPRVFLFPVVDVGIQQGFG